MPILISLLIFVIMYIFSYVFIKTYFDATGTMAMRVKALGNITQRRTDSEQVLAKSLTERILLPLAKRYSAFFKGLTPVGATQLVEKRLLMAGGVAGLTAEQFIALVGVLCVLLLLAGMGFAFLHHYSVVKTLTVVLYTLVAGISLPLFMLSRKIAVRQASIQKDLPDVLDMVTISVEAGLSFDGALAKLAEKMKGTLVDEFNRVLQEMRMGITRKDALKAMSARCGNNDLSIFVSALVQADQLGVSIGSILRVQARSIRQKRQNYIEQKANKAPIKMLFPLAVCIFPTLFIVLLGPPMLKIYTQFIFR